VPLRPAAEALNRENYHHFDSNPVTRVAEPPVSTFSIDVDTGTVTVWRDPHPEGLRVILQWIPAGGIITSRGLLLFQF
jgi:hypothetical protein